MSEKIPVYRMVDGKRERIQNDERDPQKRYAQVSNINNGEQYFLEFTEEEEKAKLEEDRQFENGRPKRETEELQRKEDFEKFRESLKYENRVVAFLDIMGWGNAIEQSEKNEELTKKLGVAINFIQSQKGIYDWAKNQLNDSLPNDLQITHFSDSVIISVTCDSLTQDILLSNLRSLVTNLLQLGYLVRGGISVGQLIHRESMVYGPALLKAYNLESKHAIVPRIILDEELSTVWRENIQIRERGKIIGYFKNWRIDIDGKLFFDYLQPFPTDSNIIHSVENLQANLNPVRALILKNLSANQDMGVLQKYIWLAGYFNSILDEYPQCKIEKITVPTNG